MAADIAIYEDIYIKEKIADQKSDNSKWRMSID